MQKTWTLEPKYCRKCRKEIYITPEWVYKDAWGVYCSWKCFNHRFDGLKKNNQKNYRYKPVEQYSLDGELIATFANSYDAAAAVDGWDAPIRDAVRLGKKYKGYLWKYAEEGGDKPDDKRTVETDICESTRVCD